MSSLSAGRIRHTVVFTPSADRGSDGEAVFLQALVRLADIPGVERFELMDQVSLKSDFRYGLSMEFADRAAYQGYNEHPEHVAFVRDHWQTAVVEFQELDFVALEA